ncbi:DUF6192 family protein [Streptomyces sp. NPDC020794]|uniref:DUF6192 family protein n=1 Tax=unclassified Streptomyces TaxID=2593676 RepID=UPI0036EEAD58
MSRRRRKSPRTESVQEKVDAIHDLAADDQVAARVASDFLRRPAVASKAIRLPVVLPAQAGVSRTTRRGQRPGSGPPRAGGGGAAGGPPGWRSSDR